jgi:hypothetical protein
VIKIRLHGTEQECATAAGRLGQVVRVLSVSRPYPGRDSGLVRVYVKARLDLPDPGAASNDAQQAGSASACPE